MPGVFGRISGAIDNLAAPIGGAANKLLRGKSMYAGVDAAKAALAAAPRGSRRAALGGLKSAQAALRTANVKTGRKAIGARSSFRWNWLRQQKKRSQRGI